MTINNKGNEGNKSSKGSKGSSGNKSSVLRRASKKRKHKPKFNVLNAGVKKTVKKRWRKPRGIDNEKRVRKKEHGACPRVGYGNPKEVRGSHPLGLKEFMVCNINELISNADKIKGNYVLRISGKVNKRNKEGIRAKAKELGIRTLN